MYKDGQLSNDRWQLVLRDEDKKYYDDKGKTIKKGLNVKDWIKKYIPKPSFIKEWNDIINNFNTTQCRRLINEFTKRKWNNMIGNIEFVKDEDWEDIIGTCRENGADELNNTKLIENYLKND